VSIEVSAAKLTEGEQARRSVSSALLAQASRIVAASAAAMLLGLLAMQMLIGYADNGDFDRSVGFAFEKPTGFHSAWERVEGAGTGDRFQSRWHDRWDLRESFEPIEGRFPRSTYKLYLLAQIEFAALMSGSPKSYSVMLGSILSRALVLIAIVGLFRQIARAVSRAAAVAFLLLASAVILDASFAGLLNSFYEEQMAIVLLPLWAWSLLLFLQKPGTPTSIFVLALSAFLGGAKTAYFYLPVLVLPLILFARVQRGSRLLLCILGVLAQWIAVQPLLTSQYPKTNAYHSMYFGALHDLPPARLAALEQEGERFDRACIGVPAFVDGGADCRDRANVSHFDTLSLLLRNPDLARRMVVTSLRYGTEIRPPYLSQRLEGAPDVSPLPPFNLMRVAFARYWHVVVAAMATLAAALILGGWAGRSRTVLGVGVALALFGGSQYAVSLADGYYELTKHLLAANYSLALAAAFLIPGLMLVARDAYTSRASLRSNSP
jgi:hypothetical protein